jgi:hypothetical protein
MMQKTVERSGDDWHVALQSDGRGSYPGRKRMNSLSLTLVRARCWLSLVGGLSILLVGCAGLLVGCTGSLSGSGTGGTTGATGGMTGVTGGSVGTGGARSLTGGTVGTGGTIGTGGVVGTGGAGTVGTGGTGTGGASSGASHCGARPGMMFCDDFEMDSAGTPPTPWTTTGQSATSTVTIDGTNPANSGTKSVHILQTDASDYDTFLQLHDTSVLPVAGGKLYLRYFIRMAQPMTMGHNTLVRGDLYASQGSGNNLLFGEDNQMIYLSINGDGMAEMSNNDYYSDGNQLGVGYPAGVWTCVELLLDHNGPEIDVWVNGTEVPDLHTTAWKVDAYDYLQFGFEKYAGPPSELWYDDIAIGTQPIGCN